MASLPASLERRIEEAALVIRGVQMDASDFRPPNMLRALINGLTYKTQAKTYSVKTRILVS